MTPYDTNKQTTFTYEEAGTGKDLDFNIPQVQGRLYGDLTVSKTVSGNDADSTKAFDFTVTLGDTSINGTAAPLAIFSQTSVTVVAYSLGKPLPLTYMNTNTRKTTRTETSICIRTDTMQLSRLKSLRQHKSCWKIENTISEVAFL